MNLDGVENDSEKLFQEKYNEINQKLLTIDGIKHCWSEFSETILLPNKSDKRKK